MNKGAIATLGIVIAVIFATKSPTPPTAPECKVNDSLVSIVGEAQKESASSSEHVRQLIALLPSSEQEALAREEKHVQEVKELEKKLVEAKAENCASPQK